MIEFSNRRILFVAISNILTLQEASKSNSKNSTTFQQRQRIAGQFLSADNYDLRWRFSLTERQDRNNLYKGDYSTIGCVAQP